MNLTKPSAARLDFGLLLNTGSRAADVERAHGELRAGLADGLRGDDAHGFAEFDHAAGGQVAAVAAARKLRGGTRR